MEPPGIKAPNRLLRDGNSRHLHRQLPLHRSGQAPQGASWRGVWAASIPLTSQSQQEPQALQQELNNTLNRSPGQQGGKAWPTALATAATEGQALDWERAGVPLQLGSRPHRPLSSRLGRNSCLSWLLGASGQPVTGCWERACLGVRQWSQRHATHIWPGAGWVLRT